MPVRLIKAAKISSSDGGVQEAVPKDLAPVAVKFDNLFVATTAIH